MPLSGRRPFQMSAARENSAAVDTRGTDVLWVFAGVAVAFISVALSAPGTPDGRLLASVGGLDRPGCEIWPPASCAQSASYDKTFCLGQTATGAPAGADPAVCPAGTNFDPASGQRIPPYRLRKSWVMPATIAVASTHPRMIISQV